MPPHLPESAKTVLRFIWRNISVGLVSHFLGTLGIEVAGYKWVLDAIRSGVAGYLLKDTPRDHLVAAIRNTVEGKIH